MQFVYHLINSILSLDLLKSLGIIGSYRIKMFIHSIFTLFPMEQHNLTNIPSTNDQVYLGFVEQLDLVMSSFIKDPHSFINDITIMGIVYSQHLQNNFSDINSMIFSFFMGDLGLYLQEILYLIQLNLFPSTKRTTELLSSNNGDKNPMLEALTQFQERQKSMNPHRKVILKVLEFSNLLVSLFFAWIILMLVLRVWSRRYSYIDNPPSLPVSSQVNRIPVIAPKIEPPASPTPVASDNNNREFNDSPVVSYPHLLLFFFV